MTNEVYVTGIGVVSAMGMGVGENLRALMNRRSGINLCAIQEGKEPIMAGRISLDDNLLMREMGGLTHPVSRTSLLGLAAAREAWQGHQQNLRLKTGLIAATSVGGMDKTEGFYNDFLADRSPDYRLLACHDSGVTTARIAKELGISGFVSTISTACSSGANAIMMGARMLRSRRLDRVLVGGADALTAFTINGFDSLMIYDRSWTRPFDATREGLNLGEGAAFLLLETRKSLEMTGSTPIAQVKGWGNAADAYHQTASSPDGKGARLAISEAINTAGIQPSDVSYINAHGTGTPNNDLSESVALKNVFNEKVPDFSSTKAFTGHTLAAAGAIEAVFSILAIREGMVWPNLNFTTPLPETGLTPVQTLKRKEIDVVLSNSFGFAGNNSSLIFTKLTV